MRSRVTEFPHVTAVLQRAGLVDTTWFKEYDLQRGSALHLASQFLDQGDLSWQTVDPVILGRLRSYQRFLDEVKPEILAIEEPVFNELYRYQGRLDRRVIINGREGILDLKGPSRAAWNGLQLSAYASCFPRPMARWNLYLSDDKYLLVEQRGRMDWQAFKAALTIAAWKESNGE